ncbi:hypothetical protein LAD77_00625 [Klebsiella pneumoniae]|nr:hypothetical protein [Klebsiella pneumoniae]
MSIDPDQTVLNGDRNANSAIIDTTLHPEMLAVINQKTAGSPGDNALFCADCESGGQITNSSRAALQAAWPLDYIARVPQGVWDPRCQ